MSIVYFTALGGSVIYVTAVTWIRIASTQKHGPPSLDQIKRYRNHYLVFTILYGGLAALAALVDSFFFAVIWLLLSYLWHRSYLTSIKHIRLIEGLEWFKSNFQDMSAEDQHKFMDDLNRSLKS